MVQAQTPGKAPSQPVRADFPHDPWLSTGFENLQTQHPGRSADTEPDKPDFDVVIVGSGYGGAIAAAELAGCEDGELNREIKVCVLERGEEYLSGRFPSRMSELAGHVRFTPLRGTHTRGNAHGLFDVRIGGDINALVANGLGGGSLINAGVMLLPHPSVLKEAAWPKALREEGTLAPWSDRIAPRLGARQPWGDRTTGKGEASPLKKHHALKVLAGTKPFIETPISVAMDDQKSSAGVPLNKCVQCGHCATGCNYGAKDSLDVNLLAKAKAQGHVCIYTGATVLRLSRRASGDGWILQVMPTDETLRKRQAQPFLLHARRVILAAGTLGSTEILLRSQTDTLKFSPRLGRQFSGNGDMVAAIHDTTSRAHAVGRESDDPMADGFEPVGPTITGMIDLRTGDPQTDLVVQELSIPGPIRRLFEEVVTTGDALHALASADWATHSPDDTGPDPCAVDPGRIERTLPVAMIGRDAADGVLSLPEFPTEHDTSGLLHMSFPSLKHDGRFEAHHSRLAELVEASALGGRVLPNPIWRALPQQLENTIGQARGPLLTVHPLGGCAMGDDVEHGVVDDLGQVFDAMPGNGTRAIHEGLLVLDGSIVPTSLGINPALTISSLALRAITRVRDKVWRLSTPPSSLKLPPARPVYRVLKPSQPAQTRLEVVEQMRGPVWLQLPGSVLPRRHWAEITLRFKPTPLDELTKSRGQRKLHVDPSRSELLIYKREPGRLEERLPQDEIAAEANLSGTLRVFHQDTSVPYLRGIRAAGAWFFNRGMRDMLLHLAARTGGRTSTAEQKGGFLKDIGQRALGAGRLATHAGGTRLFDYQLEVEWRNGMGKSWLSSLKPKPTIQGQKRLNYHHASNPWRQLSEVELSAFPYLKRPLVAPKPVLSLNLPFFAREQVPLLRVVSQEDQPSALADLASLGLYLARMVLQVHVWNFRLPDRPAPRKIERLAGVIEGMPAPQITEIEVSKARLGNEVPPMPVRIRLTRYQSAKASATDLPPVLLIHGYSASSTTFAHHSVRPNLAEYLCKRDRDVWIVDLRSSAGLPTATLPWSFEDIGLQDIPLAVEHIVNATGHEKIDVVAHCMGSAMLAMALLGEIEDSERKQGYGKERGRLKDRIRRLVMSQVGPLVVMSPANVFRAYLLRYLQHFLPLDNYKFRAPDTPSALDDLLDRVLASQPYPEDEIRQENPIWPPHQPWTGTRHRMDALYGRVFKLKNMSPETLNHLDDFFGPLNISTVTQVIHFVRYRAICDRLGNNRYVMAGRLQAHMGFPCLSIHGTENGLADPATLDLMKSAFGNSLEVELFEAGHQDCLIGLDAVKVFRRIESFLARTAP
jgi:cholesterol oxidase